jgi:hypothetical protein
MSVTTAAKLVIKPSSNTLKNRAPSSGVHTFLAIEPPHITPENRINNRQQRELLQMERMDQPNRMLEKKEEKKNEERASGENEDFFPQPKGGRGTNLHSLGRRRARATKRRQTKQKKTKRRRTKSMRKKRRMTRSTTRRR